MATFLQAADRLPKLTGSAEKDVKSLHNYVYSLQEALRYTLGNLGEDNFNETELSNIQEPVFAALKKTDETLGELYTQLSLTEEGLQLQITQNKTNITSITASYDGLETRVADAEGNISSVKQSVDGLEITTEGKKSYISGDKVKSGTIVGSTVQAFGDWLGGRSSAVEVYDADPDAGGNLIGGISYQYVEEDRYMGDKLYIVTESYGVHSPSIKVEAAGNVSIEALTELIYMEAPEYITLSAPRINLRVTDGVYINDVKLE